jgi:hypothetical protein
MGKLGLLGRKEFIFHKNNKVSQVQEIALG